MNASVSDEGKSCTSKSVNCGILPGSEIPCSEPKFLIKVTMRCKHSRDITLCGSRFVFPCLLGTRPLSLRCVFLKLVSRSELPTPCKNWKVSGHTCYCMVPKISITRRNNICIKAFVITSFYSYVKLLLTSMGSFTYAQNVLYMLSFVSCIHSLKKSQ